MKYAKCPVCNGTGIEESLYEKGSDILCGTCRGTGSLSQRHKYDDFYFWYAEKCMNDLIKAETNVTKIDDLKNQLAHLSKQLDTKISDSKITHYQDLKAKAETFEILLRTSADEIHEQIELLTEKLQKRLNEE